jgi:cytochrome c
MRQGLIVLAGAALVACGAGEGPSGGASSDRANVAPDPDRGELLSLACQACHSLGPRGAHLVGPNLSGIFGRAAGTAPGFGNYSGALKGSGIVWSPAELDRWLADPTGFLPGTTMAFAGYQSAEDRSALIAFLKDATGPGMPPAE